MCNFFNYKKLYYKIYVTGILKYLGTLVQIKSIKKIVSACGKNKF